MKSEDNKESSETNETSSLYYFFKIEVLKQPKYIELLGPHNYFDDGGKI